MFARAFSIVGAQRTRLLAERLTAQVSRTTLARVAAAILPYAGPGHGLTQSLPPLRDMTQIHLATAAGTVKEVANRALTELAQAGAIHVVRGRVARIDRERLTAFASMP